MILSSLLNYHLVYLQQPLVSTEEITQVAFAVQMFALANDKYAAALKQNKLDQIEKVKQMDREVNGGV